MIDLSNKASHRYWFDYPDPMIYKVLTIMEGVEDFTVDGEKSFELAMFKLGEVLEEISSIGLKKEDELIKIGAYVKAARLLRVLQCLDTARPGDASKLLSYAEEKSAFEDTASLFLKRNIAFERLRLLGRVFAQERLALISKALEESED